MTVSRDFILDLSGRFEVFSTVPGGKITKLACICVVCIGTKAKKALKFNLKTMVFLRYWLFVLLVGLCFVFHGMPIGISWMGFPGQTASSMPYARSLARCRCIRDWTVLPNITTTKWVMTA